tara:strand:- start:800 stop:1027 length:228 start_codon:yes stop_codon:yes gene_type:complete
MPDYGIYNNASDFYNSLGINDQVKININGGVKIGNIIATKCLGVRALVILCKDQVSNISYKYACFPKNCNILEIA